MNFTRYFVWLLIALTFVQLRAAELHRHAEWRSIPIVVLTAKDLTAEELLRLNGNVHTILDKGGCSRDELMRQVRDLLAEWAVPAGRDDHLGAAGTDKNEKVKTHV